MSLLAAIASGFSLPMAGQRGRLFSLVDHIVGTGSGQESEHLMINVTCTCGVRDSLPESGSKNRWLCPSCGKATYLVCAEELPEGAGEGDFDASVIVLRGPCLVGERMLIGGVADIELGKAEGTCVCLPGENVGARHCLLCRVDYGPSRWKVSDCGSECGTFVNSDRVQDQELASGDEITVGDFDLLYQVVPAMPEPAMVQAAVGASSAGHATQASHTTQKASGESQLHQPFYVPTSHHAPPEERSLWGRLAFWRH